VIRIRKMDTLEHLKYIKAKHLPYELLSRLFSTTSLTRDDVEDDKYSVKDVYDLLDDTREHHISEIDRLDDAIEETFKCGNMLHCNEFGEEAPLEK